VIFMKLNFSMLKNENIGFRYTMDGKTYSFCDKLLSVKQSKKSCEFVYENNKMVVENSNFSRLKFEQDGENYYFVVGEPNVINGLVGFTMSDTYGFPMDLTKEILEEDGLVLDVKGMELVQFLSKKKSRENQKVVGAF
jgi:alanyl-tRNA synthetase